MALLSVREGTFHFVADAGTAAGELTVGGLLMDAVRLEDERDRRAEHIPDSSARLALRSPSRPIEDSWGCGLDVVVEALSRQRVTRETLERDLPLAPIRIQLALAVLVERNLLGERAPSSTRIEVQRAPTNELGLALLRRFPAGLRLVVGCTPNLTSAELEPALASLAASLQATLPERSHLNLSGPSFLRLRPPHGGFVSLTFLPMMRKDRFLLKTLVPSLDAAILSLDAPPEEIAAWTAELAAAPALLQATLPKGTCTADCLTSALLTLLRPGPLFNLTQ